MHIVLLPGMDGTGDLFDDLLVELDKGISAQVIRYPQDRELGYTELAAFVRNQLPTQGKFVVLGESFSGPVAILVASTIGDSLAGLVLCASFSRCPQPTMLAISKPFWRAAQFLANRTAALRLLLGPYFTAKLSAKIIAALGKADARVVEARMRAVASVDVTAQLSAINVPTLYLKASYDLLVPSGSGKLIRSINGTIEMHEIAGPHFLLQSSPREAAKIIGDFCKKL